MPEFCVSQLDSLQETWSWDFHKRCQLTPIIWGGTSTLPRDSSSRVWWTLSLSPNPKEESLDSPH